MLEEQTFHFEHKDMRLVFDSKNNDVRQKSFNTLDVNTCNNITPVHNFLIGIAGRPYGSFSALTQCYSSLAEKMFLEKCENFQDHLHLTYINDARSLTVEVYMQAIPGCNIIKQYTKVTNNSTKPIVLNHVSSLFFAGLGEGGIIPWHQKERFKVHYCRQTWCGEGQWQNNSLAELGLYNTDRRLNTSAIHLSSIGSWSTGRYAPMIILEDTETKKVWYSQIETSANWHFEIGYKGNENFGGSLFIHADSADERFGGWTKKLLPGENFVSVPAVIGCCSGGFNEAVKELTIYRRTLKPQKTWDGEAPVIFNDFMHCLWTNSTSQTLLPLIDAATNIGAECFCLDAGWHCGVNERWFENLGDWIPSHDRFGQNGLQEILDYIKMKGMRPGLWFEIEVCGENSKIGKKPDSWFLQRNGKRVGGDQRWFFNFTNPEVREHFHGVFDKFVSMGVSFIKNDYNMCAGNGDDSASNSSADGLLDHIRAFYTFIDNVKKRHPDLIIENCASGAMRSDYGILAHFDMQSFSDQECYTNYPAIITGSLATILPEQLGIWTCPYPLTFDNKEKTEVLISEEYRAEMADGEQTIFSMVNGLCGNMYLSGHPEVADKTNVDLIQEGVSLYKKERMHIHSSYLFFPIGVTNIYNKKSWAAVGFENPDNKRLLLAVWKLDSDSNLIEIPLPKAYKGKNTSVRQLYPAEKYDVEVSYNTKNNTLTINMPQKYQARYFEINSL